MNYATPHGIYTYLLTKEVLDELFLNKTIDGQNDFEMLGLEINPNKRGILFIEWPEKIEKFGIGNEIYIKLEDKIECRLAKISSDNQDLLGSIDGIKLNNPV